MSESEHGIYECRRPDHGEDWHDVKAWDPEDAAQKYCDECFSDWSYPGGPLYIEVRTILGIVESVEVTIEHVPSFHGATLEYKPTRQCPIHAGDARMQRHVRNDGFCPECFGVFPDLVKDRWMNKPAHRASRILAWKVNHPDAAIDISDDDVIHCIDMDENGYDPYYRKRVVA